MAKPNPYKQIQQLRKWQVAANRDISAVVLQARRNVAALLLKASTEPVGTLKAQNKLYGEIEDVWKLAAVEIDAWAKDITDTVGRHFRKQAVSQIQHQTGKKKLKSSVVKYDRKASKELFGIIHPGNRPHIAAVFTDKMSDQMVQTLRNTVVATYRQGSVEGWSNRQIHNCLLYTSPSPRDGLLSRMPSSA